MASRPPPKKVRLACQRCRQRRIKCDSKLPACSNCAKAGELCLDVGGKDSDLLTPRNFAGEARARIQWLEDIIRARLPDVDLSAGPQLDLEPSSSEGLLKRRQSTGADDSGAAGHDDDRPALERDEPFAEKAYSVAMNLGMVTLNSDSLQRHYMGSSSGLLFTNLIGASPASSSQSAITPSPAPVGSTSWDDGPSPPYMHGATEQRHRSLHLLLRQELPRLEDAMSLAHTYIQWIHPEYPVLEPESLLSAVDALYACAAAPSTDYLRDGWPVSIPAYRWNTITVHPDVAGGEKPSMAALAFIVFMVLNVAAIVQVRRRVFGFAPERYYKAAMLFAPECFSQISLSTTQALIILIVHCLHTPAEANLWTLIHIGQAYCTELGIHREHPVSDLETEEFRQLKRFIFYTVYSLDRSISSIQGRPLGLRDEALDVCVPGLPTLDRGRATAMSPFASCVQWYAHHNMELQKIISDIKTQLYLLPVKTAQGLDASLTAQRNIHDRLKWWGDSIHIDNFDVQGCDPRQIRAWRLRLQIRFNTTMILLFQPSQVIRHPKDSCLETVFNSAASILRDYQLLDDSGFMDSGWRAVQNVFAAGAALVYSFWTSKAVQERTYAITLSKSLRTCTSLLSIGGQWWPSAKTSLANFGSIVDLTTQRIYSQPPRAKQPRLAGRGIDSQRGVLAEAANGGSAGGLQATSDSPQDLHLPASHFAAGQGLDQTMPSSRPAMDWGGEGSPPGLQTPEDQWPIDNGRDTPTQPMAGLETFPEIEHFLADFDKSGFSWNVPMSDTEDFDLSHIMH